MGAEADRFLDACRRRGLRRATLDNYEQRARLLEVWADERRRRWWELTASEVERWLDEGARSVWTRRAYGVTARMMLDWAADEGLIVKSPARRIVLPRTPQAWPRPLADADLARALSPATGHLRVALLLGALAGLRAGEIAGVRVQDVDLSAMVLSVAEGKGGRPRRLPLHPLLATEISAHVGARRRGGLLDGWSSVGPTTSAFVTVKVARHLRGLGIDGTAHQLRHWFATQVYSGCRDIRTVQELLGHASPSTTQGYARWDVSFGVSAVGALALPQGMVAAQSARSA